MGLINLIDGVKPDSADGGDRLQMPEEMPGTFRRQAIFLSCLWAVWLSFIVSTMGQAPKKVRRASTCPGRPRFRFWKAFFCSMCNEVKFLPSECAVKSSSARNAGGGASKLSSTKRVLWSMNHHTPAYACAEVASTLQGNRQAFTYQPRPAPVPVRSFGSLQIRIRCQVFFGLACAMTIAVVVAAALLSRAGQVFLGIMVGWNVVQGVFLTYDVREWPHRLQEVLPYCAYYCETNFPSAGKMCQGPLLSLAPPPYFWTVRLGDAS